MLKGAATPLFILLLIVAIALLVWDNDRLRTMNAQALERVDSLKVELDEKKAALGAARTAANDLAERLQAAEARAAQARVVTQTKVVKVYAKPVPGDCEGAVNWGAMWGAGKGRSWAVQ